MNVRSAWGATAWYVGATIAATWPTLAGLARNIPWDLGDSLMVCWILGWDADHVLRFLGGEWGALRGFWTANIFGREPLSLAYGEHLIALALPITPVYALTKNLILCYNLLFLASFVLSGLGTYLWVRDITGSSRGAFSPFVLAYVLFEIGRRRLWSDRKMWGMLSMAAIGVAACTIPFLLPSLELRRLGQPARPSTRSRGSRPMSTAMSLPTGFTPSTQSVCGYFRSLRATYSPDLCH